MALVLTYIIKASSLTLLGVWGLFTPTFGWDFQEERLSYLTFKRLENDKLWDMQSSGDKQGAEPIQRIIKVTFKWMSINRGPVSEPEDLSSQGNDRCYLPLGPVFLDSEQASEAGKTPCTMVTSTSWGGKAITRLTNLWLSWSQILRDIGHLPVLQPSCFDLASLWRSQHLINLGGPWYQSDSFPMVLSCGSPDGMERTPPPDKAVSNKLPGMGTLAQCLPL